MELGVGRRADLGDAQRTQLTVGRGAQQHRAILELLVVLSAAQIRRRREDVQHRHRRHRYELWHDLARQPNEGVERHFDLVAHRGAKCC